MATTGWDRADALASLVRPDEVAWLYGTAASAVTGQVITVTGREL